MLAWVAWSAAGVMVLTSTSALIGQEIAAIPLLWIIPLLLYLLTWIVAFAGGRLPHTAGRCGLILASLVLILPALDPGLKMSLPLRLGGALAAMTLACLAIHSALYHRRPEKHQLTHFYAAIAGGGMLGGILAGVVAVQVFDDWRDVGLAYGLAAALCCGDLVRRPGTAGTRRVLSYGTIALMIAICIRVFAVTGMERPGLLYKNRDFHGLVRVVEEGVDDPIRHRLVLYSGSTVHGMQLMDPRLRTLPTTYFGRGTGAQFAIRSQRSLTHGRRGLKIGVVGLGAGTLAAHLREEDTMRFYEINPVIAEIAQGGGPRGNAGAHFSYLSDAPGKVEVVLGDARICLAAELQSAPRGNAYDLLLLDAFAGDAVPMHLLTSEAFDLYTRHLAPGGMMAVHVSSNWLDLMPVIYAWAQAEDWEALTISTRAAADGVSGAHAVWVLLFRGIDTMRALAGECRPMMASGGIIVQNRQNVTWGDLRPWTDDHCDLLALMRTRIRLRDLPPSAQAAAGTGHSAISATRPVSSHRIPPSPGDRSTFPMLPSDRRHPARSRRPREGPRRGLHHRAAS